MILCYCNSNQIRGCWKLGKVSDVYPGKDGNVRNVDVQYKVNINSPDFNMVRRAVQRLVVILPVEEQ